MTARPLEEFARQNGLSYAERGRLPSIGFLLTKDRLQTTDILGGKLPGDIYGAVAQVTAPESMSLKEGVIDDLTLGLKQPKGFEYQGGSDSSRLVRRHTVLLTRIPEAPAFMPFLACREDTKRGVMDHLVGPGGLLNIMRELEMESIKFNKRYRVGIWGSDENRLRQLFSPTFIDWLAETAPEDLYFDLVGGVLCVSGPGEREEADAVRELCEFGARVAERIRSEALEEVGLRSTLSPEAKAKSEATRAKADEMLNQVSFSAPPTSVSDAAKEYRDVVEGGFLGRGKRKKKALALGFLAVMRAYAERHGLRQLDLEEQRDFVFRNQRLEIPGRFWHTLTGELPGIGVEGIIVFLERQEGDGDRRIAPLVVFQRAEGAEPTALRVAPRGESKTALIGGFRIKDVDGSTFYGEPGIKAAAESLAGTGLGKHYEVESAAKTRAPGCRTRSPAGSSTTAGRAALS